MAECTTPAQISESDYEAARAAGLLIVTVAEEIAVHKFAEATRAPHLQNLLKANLHAIEVVAMRDELALHLRWALERIRTSRDCGDKWNAAMDCLQRWEQGSAETSAIPSASQPEPCAKCRKPWVCDEKGCMDKAASAPASAAASQTDKLCPQCGAEEWDRVDAERGRERDVPFNRCAHCGNEWEAR